MERLSLNLWSVLNSDIGCKELVHIRRSSIHYNEILWNYSTLVRGIKVERVLSGSRSEGFDLADSDYDYMNIHTDVTVLPADFTQTQGSNIIMETDNIKPGFARLRLSCEKFLPMFPDDIVTEWNGGLYISSLFYRDFSVDINPGSYAHGPCFTYANRLVGTEQDAVLCYQCKVWPSVASDWIHRCRPNNWPPRELINNITEDGCLLVPIGNPSSPTGFLEWRMSFSLAERKLVHSLNHTQFLCYGLLKIFLKHAVNCNGTTKDLLCSYFMKTILFYVIEEEPLIWEKQNLFTCFWACFKRLLSCIREGSCSNYFVKHNNMFEHKIVGVNKETLLQYLYNLYDGHFEVLARIPNFAPLFWNLHLNSKLLPASELDDMEFECNCFLEFTDECSFVVTKSLHEINMIQSFIQSDLIRTTIDIYDKEILISCIYKFNYEYTHYLYQLYLNKYHSLSNKLRYIYLTVLKNHIIYNCTGFDICNGWLQYATLGYLTGQYRRVVRVMDYVLSKFKPYTLVYGFVKTSNRQCFKETICGNNLSISDKRRIAAASFTFIIPECEFYPHEIKPEILVHAADKCTFLITSHVYVYILKCLSCQKLGYGELGVQVLDKLYEILGDEEFDSRFLPACFGLVAKCRSLVTNMK